MQSFLICKWKSANSICKQSINKSDMKTIMMVASKRSNLRHKSIAALLYYIELIKATKSPQISYNGRLTCRGFKCSINNTFLHKNLPISAKNTTFAAKFNKNLPIMSYISVAQYASIWRYKKDCSESSLFCIIVPTLISVYNSPTWCYACRQTWGTPRA